MSKMIDGEKVIKAIKDGIANDWSMSAREAIEIIRKYEQPVSGDDNPRLEASFIADSISDYGKKQPVSGGDDKQPTDETLRDALQLAIYEITHLCPEENDGSHRPIISKAVLTKLRQALSQPSKPAMTMEELVKITGKAIKKRFQQTVSTTEQSDGTLAINNGNFTFGDLGVAAITALSEAGVITVKE